MLSIMKTAYRDFVERVGEVGAPRGAKTAQVLTAIAGFTGEFTVTMIEQTCPGVSRDMVRRILQAQQSTGAVECKGRGPAARWRKTS